MKKVCIVPIFGDYDTLKEPTFKSKGWDYICISDKHHESDVWKSKIFRDDSLTNKQKTGYVLTQIHKLIDYDVCVIVGGQIQINTDLNNYIFEESFVALDHPSRNCVYKEAQACILLDKDNPKVIAKQMYRYLEHGLPLNKGMIQTGVTIRRKDKELIEFMERWWYEISTFSQRDQLSFNYVNWMIPIKYKTISSDLLHKEFKLCKHG
jgi:hypothetical protein